MRKCFLAVVVCAFSATMAFGQSAEISVSGGVSRFGGKTLAQASDTDTTPLTLTNGFRLAIRFTWNQGKFFSHEIGYGYARSHIHYQSNPVQDVSPLSMHQGLYDFLVNVTPEGSKVRPFACGGAQFTSFFLPGSSNYYGNQITQFGVNYGGGIKFRLTSVWGVRFDIRQYAMGKPDFGFAAPSGWMRQTEVTGGFSFNF